MQILTMFRGFMSKRKEIKLNKSNKKRSRKTLLHVL